MYRINYHAAKVQPLIPLGFEPRTSRVLGERDNHYTMESALMSKALKPWMFLGWMEIIKIYVYLWWNHKTQNGICNTSFSCNGRTQSVFEIFFALKSKPTSGNDQCAYVTSFQLSKSSTRMGFEPTRAEPNGLAVHRLNHSATSSCISRRKKIKS